MLVLHAGTAAAIVNSGGVDALMAVLAGAGGEKLKTAAAGALAILGTNVCKCTTVQGRCR